MFQKKFVTLSILIFFLSLFLSLLIATPAYSPNGEESYCSISFSGGIVYLNEAPYSLKLQKILEIKDSFKEKGKE